MYELDLPQFIFSQRKHLNFIFVGRRTALENVSTWENAYCKFPLQTKGGDVIECGGLKFSWAAPFC